MTQECTRCERQLPDEAFSKDVSRDSGLNRYCRECVRWYWGSAKPAGWVRKTADRRAYDRERYRLRVAAAPPVKRKPKATEEQRAAKERERSRKREQARRQKAKTDPAYRQKYLARKAFRERVRRGTIKREPCVVCGEKAEAHHPDYSKPFDVVWLCSEHHRDAHAMMAR